ncbi:hypothetical protein [Companilactobacillus jidongensis]|uniref:hypothetical protein n=1 Tax=Companilactobacillus jidongensis TaxID=2486006 RepID=UPI000F7758AE|nr:hypothetical protein [Companilactobacillus jidongensis]
MSKKNLTALLVLLIGGGFILGGCSAGNVSISDNSTKKEQPKETKADKLKEKENAKKEKTEQAKEMEKKRGKEYTYGLPKGPSWMYIYDNGKKTTGHLDPNKTNIVRLHENDALKIGGPLPLVGELFSREFTAAGNSTEATMDDSDKFDKEFNLERVLSYNSGNGVEMITKLTHLDNQGVSDMAFGDLPKYLDAASTNDPSKLPNQSEELRNSLDGTNNLRGDSAANYQVMEQYFDKKSALYKSDTDNNFDAEKATYVVIKNNSETSTIGVTNLYVQIFAKVKKTDTDQHEFRTDDGPKLGSTKTEMEDYQMEYTLRDGNWELVNVFKGETSPYSMDTSGSNWIIKKN